MGSLVCMCHGPTTLSFLCRCPPNATTTCDAKSVPSFEDCQRCKAALCCLIVLGILAPGGETVGVRQMYREEVRSRRHAITDTARWKPLRILATHVKAFSELGQSRPTAGKA